MTKPKAALFFLLLLFLLGGAVVAFSQKSFLPGPVACTMEAKLCPDGSAVGRSGPRCEFAPCPVATTTPNDGAGDEGDPDSTVIITQDDFGKVVHVPIDQNFKFKLADLKWKFTFSNPSIVKGPTDPSFPPGGEPMFTAIAGGKTTVSAVGAPDCKPGEMCAQFLVNFQTTIIVDK